MAAFDTGVVYTPDESALRSAVHSMIVALRSAALEAELRGYRMQADALTDRADLGEAALRGHDAFMAFLNAYETRGQAAA